MKKRSNTNRQSFVKLYISSILSAAIILALLFLIVTVIQSAVLNRGRIARSRIGENLDVLRSEEYDMLPSNLLKQGDFAIYDEDGEVVFSVGEKALTDLTGDQLSVIPSTPMDGRTQTSCMVGDTGYVITKASLMHDGADIPTMKYAFIDYEGNVKGGDLLEEKTKFTESELLLFQGVLSGIGYVSTYEYSTNSGRRMTLLLCDVSFDEETPVKRSDIVMGYGALMVILVVVALIALAFLMSKKAERSIKPLQDAMSAYRSGLDFELQKDDVPVEFDSAVDAFNNLRDSLKQEQGEKQRMLADISHDLRTPLTVIKGYSQAMMDGKIKEEQYLKYTNIINLKAEAASKLLESLMEYARLDHPDYSLKPERVDFAKMCREYADIWSDEFQLSNMTLKTDISEKPLYVDCDEKMIYRLFENLLQNSLKYGAEGGSVEVSVKQVGDSVQVVISDNGRGISEDVEDRLFDAFVTSNKARSTEGGVGLGLAISKKIAALHGGTIRFVRSGGAKGATFEILLPIAELKNIT